MNRLLIIDNFDSFTYNIHHLLIKCGASSVDVVRNNEINFDSILGYDAVVLSPGPGIPSEAGQLMAAISFSMEKIPILGICLGHQAIAEFFGGSLINLKKVYHGEQSLINLDNDELFHGIPNKIRVGRYHSWAVDSRLSNELRIIAKDEFETIMAIKHKTFPVYGIQFHPESILTEYAEEIVTNWVNIIDTKLSLKSA